MEARRRGFSLIVVVIWLVILTSVIFAYGLHSASDLVTVSVMPEVPRKGQPVEVTVNLNNADGDSLPVSFDFFVNAEKVKSGSVVLAPSSTRKYSYTYISDAELGEQTSFAIRATSYQGDTEKVVTIPAYSPRIWSSFVSFASFSTSVMGSMASMIYYQDNFILNPGLQIGIVFAIVLLALLVFRELTARTELRPQGSTLVALRLRFATVAAILLIIFLGMIFTNVILILR